MKILFFMIAVLGFMFISQDTTYAQKKSKKIETWEVKYHNCDYTYCYSNGSYDQDCMEKMKITFSNNSKNHISSITFILKIINSNGSTLYKNKHTVKVDLDPGEKAPCKEFYLKEKVSDYQYSFTDVDVDLEILSVK